MARYRIAAAGIIAFSLQGVIASTDAPGRLSDRDSAQLTQCTCPYARELWTHLNVANASLEGTTAAQTGHITVDVV